MKYGMHATRAHIVSMVYKKSVQLEHIIHVTSVEAKVIVSNAHQVWHAPNLVWMHQTRIVAKNFIVPAAQLGPVAPEMVQYKSVKVVITVPSEVQIKFRAIAERIRKLHPRPNALVAQMAIIVRVMLEPISTRIDLSVLRVNIVLTDFTKASDAMLEHILAAMVETVPMTVLNALLVNFVPRWGQQM